MTTNGNGTTNGTGTMQLRFLHPKDSREFKAEIGNQTTGAKALDGLLKEKFLEPALPGHTYVLQSQRTGATIPLSSPFVDAGVQDKDIIAVTDTMVGANG